ncbi:MAG: hypothetical protein FWG52_05725 [Proteobacteria bacterium]|nr:hypothetical protein [Pseudomonadota bacterium]
MAPDTKFPFIRQVLCGAACVCLMMIPAQYAGAEECPSPVDLTLPSGTAFGTYAYRAKNGAGYFVQVNCSKAFCGLSLAKR